jgi:Tol biopolymer transport system component
MQVRAASIAVFSALTFQLALAQSTVRVTLTNSGAQSAQSCWYPSMSGSGRYVAFRSSDAGLAGQPSTGDIFVCDRDPDGNGVFDEGNGFTRLMSVSTGGIKGNSSSDVPTITSDGRFVVFLSAATNLVALPDNNGPFPDLYLHDRDPDANGIFDEGNGVTSRITGTNAPQPNDFFADRYAISADGRYIAFATSASNLNIGGGDSNGQADVYRFDRQTSTLQLVSIKAGGAATGNGYSRDPDMSADGRYIAFYSNSSDLTAPAIVGDHVYVRDMQTATTICVSRSSTGALGNQLSFEPGISADGRYVAFSSYATNFSVVDTGFDVDVYVRDLVTNTTELVSTNSFGAQASGPGTIASHEAVLSSDGRYVAFWSLARSLYFNVPGHTQVFVHDRTTGQTRPVSTDSHAVFGTDNSANFSGIAMSADGRQVAFVSSATNLVPGDTNNRDDIFVHSFCYDPAVEVGYSTTGSSGLTPVVCACGTMATGTQGTVTLHFALPTSLSAAFTSSALNPHPFMGGTLAVGQPYQIHRVTTNALGEAVITLPGGGGPSDLYLQWVMRDGALPNHVSFSNAIRITVLP